MNVKDYVTYLLPKTINYRAARLGLLTPSKPITLTYSVTAACQSRCKTCNIGLKFHQDPKRKAKDLTLVEIEKVFKSLGYCYFLNFSGGEPFLRNDLVEIVELALRYLKPRIIHTPTNAFMSEKIEKTTREILDTINKYDSNIPFTVKPSIDGIGEKHDEIRGLPGSFERLKETIKRLKQVENEYENFHLELGTVVSTFNINDLDEIEDWVHEQGVQSYRNEIAEQREEFFNIGEDITPSSEVYEKLMKSFKEKVKSNLKNKKSLAKTTESMRLVYYDLVVKILREKKQIIPCYAGISNIHLNYDGNIWPCCVLGYAHSMGNIRDYDFDYNALYNSQKAKEVRKYIKEGNCYCPLANQAYSNMIISLPSLFKMVWNFIKYR